MAFQGVGSGIGLLLVLKVASQMLVSLFPEVNPVACLKMVLPYRVVLTMAIAAQGQCGPVASARAS